MVPDVIRLDSCTCRHALFSLKNDKVRYVWKVFHEAENPATHMVLKKTHIGIIWKPFGVLLTGLETQRSREAILFLLLLTQSKKKRKK